MSSPVTFSYGLLTNPYCFVSPQQFFSDMQALTSGTVSITGVVISQSTPAVGDRDKLWVKLDSSGRPVGQYIFLGSWLSENSRTPTSGERIIWADTEAKLWAYDGGDGTDPGAVAPTATTGAMWQKDTAFNFAIPMGAGTNPTQYDGAGAGTVLAQGATLGEERHKLSMPEMQHQHFIFNTDELSDANGTGAGGPSSQLTAALYVPRTIRHAGDNVPYLVAGGTAPNNGTSTVASVGLTSGPNGDATVEKSHQNLPPVVGVFFAKRTIRAFYVG